MLKIKYTLELWTDMSKPVYNVTMYISETYYTPILYVLEHYHTGNILAVHIVHGFNLSPNFKRNYESKTSELLNQARANI